MMGAKNPQEVKNYQNNPSSNGYLYNKRTKEKKNKENLRMRYQGNSHNRCMLPTCVDPPAPMHHNIAGMYKNRPVD